MKNLVWDSCLFLFFGKRNPPEKYGEPRAKPKVWPRIAYFVNMEVHSLFGDSSVEILVTYISKINHQRVQVWIQHQKFTNRAFYIKSFIKKKQIWKTWFGIHVFSFFLASEILLRSMGNPSAKPKGVTTNSTFVNMEVRSICCMFGDSSVEILVIYILKNNHQRVQVWIQHQKFTKRAFYIKSFMKKKHMKNLVWDSCLFLLFGKWNPPEKYGEP